MTNINRYFNEICCFFIQSIFCLLFFRIIIGKSSIEGGVIFLILTLLIGLAISTRKFNIENITSKKLEISIIISIIVIIFTELFFHSYPIKQALGDLTNKQIFIMYNINYIYIGVFLFIPILIQTTNYKYNTFFNTVTFFNIIYIIFNLYLSFILKLDRLQINSKLGSVINYDNMCIIFAILSFIYSFHLKTKYSNIVLFISLLSILLNINHATRSTWLILPFLFITIFWIYRYKSKNIIIISLLSCILGVILILTTKNNFITRIYDTIHDINAILHQSDQATSIGSRIDMWRIALLDFFQSPIYGKGTFNIAENLCYLSQQGLLAGNCLTHMHNIFFQELATHGILGFISICTIIFLPLIYFIKKYFHSENTTIKFLSLSACFCIFSFLSSSITDFYFITNIAAAFYGLIVFTLYGLITCQEKN